MYRQVFILWSFVIVILAITARKKDDDINLIIGIRTALVQYNLLRYRLKEYNAK